MIRLRGFLVLFLLLVTSLACRVDYRVLCEDSDSMIIGIEANKCFVSQGFPMNFTVTVENNGTVEESFNLTLYANAEVIGWRDVMLLPDETETATFVWEADVERGDYCIRAETNISFVMEGPVYVTLTGDVNNDYTVNIKDLFLISKAFGSVYGEPAYNALYDIDNNGVVNVRDLFTVAKHFGLAVNPQHCTLIQLEYVDGTAVLNASVEVFHENSTLAQHGSVNHHGTYYPMLQEGTYYTNATTSLGLQQSSDLFNMPETSNVTLHFGVVSVTVQFDDGTPIGNVDVYANETWLGRTDSTGNVSACGLLGPEYYEVEAYSWGTPFGSTVMEVQKNGTGVATIELQITIVYSVTIHVTHEDGTAISSSPVIIVDSGDNVVANGDTDINGKFYTNLLSGTYTAQVTSSSTNAYKEKTFFVPGTTVTVTFNDKVTVTVLHSGSPVEGAYVAIEDLLSGFTGPSGTVSWCGELDPNTSYYAEAHYDSLPGSAFFTTDSAGGADVTVYI